MTTGQKDLYQKIKKYVNTRSTSLSDEHAPLDMPELKAADRAFVEELAKSLHLRCQSVVDGDGNRHLQLSFPDRPEMDGEESDEDEESQNALLRVFKQYDRAKIEDVSAEEAQSKARQKYDDKFGGWKNKHYMEKLGWGVDDEVELTKLTENYVQGLQWVLFYYYRGVASWPWYYQYHYAPMISDVKKGLNANMQFDLGQPFRPFQQLMGVLPDRSKKIVPQVYHDLMSNPESPIIDFYPRDFELDMNGKKQEWEAVVKIPFIDEKRLLAAMAPKDAMLDEAQKKRNEFGVTLKFTYSEGLDFTYPSSLPGYFPDLEHCHCVENIFELPTMEGLDVYVGLVEGVKLGEAALAGFPSLHTLPHTGTLGFHGVSVFQQESRNESMVVTLSDGEEKGTIAHARERLGKAVHVGFPFLQEGKVTSVNDEMFSYHLADPTKPAKGANVVQIPHPPQGISDWKKKANRIENFYSKRLGMVIGTVESLIQVDMLVGLTKTEQGATIKEYGPILGMEPDYATQTIVDRVVSEDQRFLEKEALPMAEEFPPKTRAFFLGDMAYGRPLEVQDVQGERAQIWVSMLAAREPEFGIDLARAADRQAPYTPSYRVAKMLSLHPLVLSKLTSAFNVNSSGLRLNLGLNLKFEAKKQKVLGYSRKTAGGWEYSQKAVELLIQYMTKFPEFVAKIESNPTGDGWEDTAFYPDPEQAKMKMKEIGNWLKSVETKSFERVPLEAEQLDGEVVMLIQQAADRNSEAGVQMTGKMIKDVPRSALLKPSDAEQRTGRQRFKLGDRIAYVLDSGRIPIAMRGTVIGMTRTVRQTLLDVVFDAKFLGGSTLNDRCSEFRGGTVPSNAVLNLSDKQVLAMSDAARARAPQQSYAPIRSAGGNMGSDGGPNLRNATAPPPLRGSFRGAVAGSQNGDWRGGYGQRSRGGGLGSTNMPIHTRGNGYSGSYRGGRGGAPNRQGFTVVDNSDPAEGVVRHNPNFRATNYSTVPPPAGLDSRGGRGRGYSRGGSRGDTRGRGNGSSRGRGRGEVTAT